MLKLLILFSNNGIRLNGFKSNASKIWKSRKPFRQLHPAPFRHILTSQDYRYCKKYLYY